MKFFAVAALFVAGALAVPNDYYGSAPSGSTGGNSGNTGGDSGSNSGGSGNICASSTLFSNPQCCSTDVLGLLGLDCQNPSGDISSATAFQATCSKEGQAPLCCVLPVAGQDVLCQPPPGL